MEGDDDYDAYWENLIILIAREHQMPRYVIGFLVTFIILSSIIQAKANDDRDQPLCSNIVKCFSIQKSYRKLTDVVKEREYMVMHAGKVFCMVSVVLLHHLGYMIRHIHYDANAIEQMVHKTNYFFLVAIELTDFMFFFSGFLMYGEFYKSRRNDPTEVIIKIVNRWFRLFSPYIIIRLFYAHILPVTNHGPLWHEMRNEAAYCKINLLEALLTLPSARTEKMCLPPSWQMAVDFQLYAIGYVCLSLCERYKTNTTNVLLSLIAVSSLLTFCNIFYNEYTTLLFLNLRHFNVDRSAENKEIFHTSYMSVVTRLGPYIVGTLVGLLAHKLKERRYVFSNKMRIVFGYLTSESIKAVIVISGLGLYNLRNTKEYSRVWHSVHGAFSHLLQNLPGSYLFLVYFVNGFECLEKRVSRIIVPLSRLTHSVSLSHFIVIHSHLFSQRTLTSYTGLYSLIHIFVADIVLTYTLAFFVYLVIEGPVQNLIVLTNSIRESKIQQFENTTPKKNE